MVVRVYNKVSGELGVSMNYKHPCSLLIVMTKKKISAHICLSYVPQDVAPCFDFPYMFHLDSALDCIS